MATTVLELSDTAASIVGRAAQLTRENIAPRAALYDREARNPVENWRDLWEAGLLNVTAPRAYGGAGVDMATYLDVLRVIAQGCASTAMTLHMHATVMRFVDRFGTEAQRRFYFGEAVGHGKLFGSWGSEPALSLSRTMLFETSIRRHADHYLIDGVKHFCTMASDAGYYMVWCALDGVMDGKALVTALVPADAPGITTDGVWDTLGMRGTYSPTVVFSGCPVPDDAILGRPGDNLTGGVVEAFGLGYAAIYLGIAQSALGFAVDFAKTRVVKPDTIPIAHETTTQRHIGDLQSDLRAVELVLADAAAAWAGADRPARAVLAARAKYLATKLGLRITSEVIQLVGGRGAYKTHPVERAFRDLRTCTLMIPSPDRMLETLGRHALGLDTAVFNVPGLTDTA